jgi:hypothetical protein
MRLKSRNTASASQPYVTWMTCGIDGLHHAITDESAVDGREWGIYPAVCGHLVHPAGMSTPPGSRCRDCAY